MLPTQPLQPPDVFHLQAALGWFELGNCAEAALDLEKIAPAFQRHPDVLDLQWHLCARARNWEACVELSETLVQSAPDRCDIWVHRSYALHELKRTEEAMNKLLPAAGKFPRRWIIPYNLACYCAQLGRLEESKTWLDTALAIDAPTVKQAAAADPDLRPLRDRPPIGEANICFPSARS